MTYREYAEKKEPNRICADYLEGVGGCPGDIIEGAPYVLNLKENCRVGRRTCRKCWDQEIPEGLLPKEAKPEPEKKKVVYVAGPITGVKRYWEPFEKAQDELEGAGYIALIPTWQPKGLEPSQYMRICFAMIDAADAVLFLPGSYKSDGATLEYNYVKYTNKPYACSLEGLKEVLSSDS